MRTLILTLGLLMSGFASAHGGHDHPPMSHLTFANGTIHAHATWQKGPLLSQESVLRIEWKNGADHSNVEPEGTFQVVLWMPGMGHGSAPTLIEKALNAQGQPIPGAYDVRSIYFIMGGDWEVNVTLIGKDGTPETQKILINLPEQGGHHHH